MQSTLVSAVNKHGSGPALYPRAAVAAQASSLLAPAASPSIARFVAAAEAAGQRTLWTHPAPPSMLLLLPGKGVGAVADIMSAKLTESGTPAVTLTLDIVHAPQTISEFEDHPLQTLDDHAHYHFFAPAGVTIDASKFLKALQAAGNQVPGMWGLAVLCSTVQCVVL